MNTTIQYQRTTKKYIENTYIDSVKEISNENSKFKVGDQVSVNSVNAVPKCILMNN